MEHIFRPIISSLLSALKPDSVAKVGCVSPDDLIALLELTESQKVTLHLIEASPSFGINEIVDQHEGTFVLHQSLALNALAQVCPSELIIMSGDPNWYTVYNSLKLIEKESQKKGNSFPCVLVQNVSWPYARRDAYLDPELVPEAFRQPHKRLGVNLGEEELSEHGGLFPDREHAIFSNELRNGVLTAVDDFRKEQGPGLGWITIPVGCGLGLLYPKKLEESNAEFKGFLDGLSMSPLAKETMEKTETTRLNAEIRWSNELRAAQEKANSRIAKIQAQLKRAEDQSGRFKDELDLSREEARELAAKSKEMVESLESLETRMAAGTRVSEASAQKLSLVEKERDLAGKEVERLKEEMRNMEENQENSQSEDQKKTEEIESSREEVQMKSSEVDKLAGENELLGQNIAFLKEQVSKLERSGQSSTQKTQEMKKDLDQARRIIGRDRKEIEELSKQLGARTQKYAKLEKSYFQRLAEIRQLMVWLESLSSELDKHLHSWTWKAGNQLTLPMRVLLGRGRVPVESFGAMKTIDEFKRWKDNPASRKPSA